MSHILIRKARSAKPLADETRIAYTGDAVDVLVSGDPALRARAEDDRGLCVVVGDRVNAEVAADFLQRWHQGQFDRAAEHDGHFVAVVLDKRTEFVVVSRDPAGFRHAYYATGHGSTAFSTSLRWLRAEGGLGSRALAIDRTSLAFYVSFQYIPSPMSPYSGVRQLAPGELLDLRPGREPDTKHVHPLIPETPAPTGPSPEAHVIDLLERSMAAQLRAPGKVGALLSGGMDTSTNIAILVDRLGVKPLALTATFREQAHDEAPYARIVAKHYGLEHLEVPIVPDLLDDLPSVVRLFDSPSGDRAIFAEYFLARAAREAGCAHIVTGEGGDEVMGPPRLRDGEDVFERLPAAWPELASWYLERTCLAPQKWRRKLLAALGAALILPESYLEGVHARFGRYSAFERLYFGQWRTWLIDNVYMKDQTLLEALDLRPVFPFMDERLMRYMAALPEETKPVVLHDKHLLKQALEHTLPPETLAKPKHKFSLPFAEWFRGPARHYLHDVLASPRSFVCAEFGEHVMRELVAEHVGERADHSRLLWGLLFLELWHAEQEAAFDEKDWNRSRNGLAG